MGGCSSVSRGDAQKPVKLQQRALEVSATKKRACAQQEKSNSKGQSYRRYKKRRDFPYPQGMENLHPMENLGTDEENLTYFHLAAQCNSFKIMENLVSWLS